MRRILSPFVIALVALATGCGDSGGDPDADAINRTYEAYIASVKQGDGRSACELLTAGFQRRITNFLPPPKQAKLKGASCPTTIAQGTLPQIQQVEPNLEQIEVEGKRARAVDPGEGLIGPSELVFERVNGDWKIANAIYFR